MSIINCVYEGGAAARAASSGATRKRAPTATSQSSSYNGTTPSAPPPTHQVHNPYQLPPPQLQKINLPPLGRVAPTEHVPLASLGYAAETAVRQAEAVELHEGYKRERELSDGDDVDDFILPPVKRPSISHARVPEREQQLQSRIGEPARLAATRNAN